jgi:hypothetical protein
VTVVLSTFFLLLGGGLAAVALDDELFGSIITFGADWARFVIAVVGTALVAVGLRGWFKVLSGSKPDPQALQDERKLKNLRKAGVGHIVVGIFLAVMAVGGLGDAVSVNEGWAEVVLLISGAWLILMGVVFWWDPRPYLKTESLRSGSGRAARAKILEVRDTGWTVNDAPRAEIDLEITIEGGQPYMATFKGTVPRLSIGRLIPGQTVPVRVDETDPNTFLVEWGKP